MHSERAFPKVKSAHDIGPDGMTYYEWLIGQLAKNPAIVKFSQPNHQDITGNILSIADKLIEKMEKKL